MSANDVKPLPCPFCGGAATLRTVARDWWRLSAEHDENCILVEHEVTVPRADEQRQFLIEDWNRRAAPSPQCDAEDSARLDWLDGLNVALNRHYGTTYRWKLVLSPNVVRLMSGPAGSGYVAAVDLHDSDARGVPSCRQAIDEARLDAARSTPATEKGGEGTL